MRNSNGRKETGKKGEETACKFLMDNGHTILERNWRTGHLEIDIISYDEYGIHFVEVKTRRPPLQAEPQDSVTAAKQKRIASAARKYLASASGKGSVGAVQKNISDCECMFDVIAVVIEDGNTRINYYPDAYYPVFF